MKRILDYIIIHRLQISICLIALIIPISKALIVPLVVLFAINIASKYKRLGPDINNATQLLLTFLPFYIVSALSLWQTDNIGAGMFDLEVKFSLLVFPILFYSIENIKINYNKVFQSYVIGVSAMLIFSIAKALCIYYQTTDSAVFYYTYLTPFHPSYYAMYACFAFVLLWATNLFADWVKIVLSSLILLSIILLSSKAGILAISLILIFFIIRFILIKNKNHTLFMLTMICLFVCGNILIKSSINRITSSIAHVQQQDVTQESSNQRLQLWEQSFIIIKKNFFSGCGSGDVNDILNSELVFKYPNWNVNLNAHNQFLQVFVGTGLVGFISFLIPIYYFIIAFYRKNKIVSLLFVLLISFNMLFESMLETQAGVVFIAFFLSLLQHQYQSEKR